MICPNYSLLPKSISSYTYEDVGSISRVAKFLKKRTSVPHNSIERLLNREGIKKPYVSAFGDIATKRIKIKFESALNSRSAGKKNREQER